MKASAKRTSYFLYPVELVWKAIGASDNRPVDPLTQEQFDNTEPPVNMIYTKALEVRQNEVFSIRMKARTFISDLRIELTPTGACETKAVFSQSVEYLTPAYYIYSKFGLNLRRELRDFAAEINKRLAASK